MRLKRRALELKRHERVIEAAAWFPNVVNERQERELAAKRAAVERSRRRVGGNAPTLTRWPEAAAFGRLTLPSPFHNWF